VIECPIVDCCESVPPPETSTATSSALTPGTERRDGWRRSGTLLGAIAVVLLPKCPACWSVYAGLSSLLGLSFVVKASYLLPLTASLLALSLGALWLQARRGRGLGPWLLACAGALTTLVGKFGLESEPLLYCGLGTLLAASLWSSCRWGWLATRAALSRQSLPRQGLPSSSLPAQN
jgi:hypothetical protein